jgi:hypothetical protein
MDRGFAMSQKQNITDVLIIGATGSIGRLTVPAAQRPTLSRRTLLRGVLLTGATAMTGIQLTGCSSSSPGNEDAPPATRQPASSASPGQRVLLARFSRPGENYYYYYGKRTNLKIGNTEVLARMISERIDCDVHRIEAVDTYPENYEETVARNVREQDADARPAIAGLPASRPPSTSTTRCCWAAQSGTSEHP